MKNIYILILGMAAVFGLSACQDEIENLSNPQFQIEVTDSTIVDDDCLVVEVSENNGTRATYSGFSSTMETGDEIGIYAWNGTTVISSNIKFTRQSDGTWTPASKVPYNASYTYCAYFPYRSDHGYTPATSGTVDARFATFIADASNRFWAADQSTKAKFTSANLCIGQGTHVGSGNRVTFSLDHKRGLAVFTGDAAEISFTGNIPYLISDSKYFLMKPSTSTEFTDEEETYSLSAAAGKYVEHEVMISIDLSMVDNAGNPRESMTTANCYLIHRAGKYKLPLVYGNAIKNGEVNTVAFYPNTSGQLTRFVNHNNDGITGPWITKSGSGVDAGMGLDANKAYMYWEDDSAVIDDHWIKDDYLYFRVNRFIPGNALCAAMDTISNKTLWSWHIWATEDDLSNTTVVSTGSHSYTVASVNLGWVPTNANGKQGYCPYYQWGRKDPFLPNTNGWIEMDDLQLPTFRYQENGTNDIYIGILNPNYFLNYTKYGTAQRIPFKTMYRNLWDAQNTATGNVTSATKKTIYDPCPPGFCVPTGNLWYYFGNGDSRSDSNWDNTNKGKTWTLGGANIFFPNIGYRDVTNSGLLTDVGANMGYYWSATPQNDRQFQFLKDGKNNWRFDEDYGGNGFPIRPVAEE